MSATRSSRELDLDVDVLVVGAGSCGAAVAGMLARQGRSVALVDARRMDHAGARWVNDIPPWMFERAGMPLPEHPVKLHDHIPFSMRAHTPDPLFKLMRPMWAIDCRALNADLIEQASAAGVTCLERVCVEELLFADGGRPIGVWASHRDRAGERYTIHARLLVDASGTSGALRRNVPTLRDACPDPGPDDLCSAAQQVCAVTDEEGAARFLQEHHAEPGEAVCFSGVGGGYSTLVIHIEEDLRHVGLLTGAISPEKTDGPRRLRAFKDEHPWVGDVTFGGAALIPVRRPYDRFVAEGVALLGDAACQVFPAHGSGTGASLVAARMLADAVTGADDPGALDVLWRYQRAFMRELGARHAASDLFRRTVQDLRGEELLDVLESGLIRPAGTLATLNQQLPRVAPEDLPIMLRGALRQPRLAAYFLPRIGRMPLIQAIYTAYPSRPDPVALRRWSAIAARIAGHPSDLPTPSRGQLG